MNAQKLSLMMLSTVFVFNVTASSLLPKLGSLLGFGGLAAAGVNAKDFYKSFNVNYGYAIEGLNAANSEFEIEREVRLAAEATLAGTQATLAATKKMVTEIQQAATKEISALHQEVANTIAHHGYAIEGLNAANSEFEIEREACLVAEATLAGTQATLAATKKMVTEMQQAAAKEISALRQEVTNTIAHHESLMQTFKSLGYGIVGGLVALKAIDCVRNGWNYICTPTFQVQQQNAVVLQNQQNNQAQNGVPAWGAQVGGAAMNQAQVNQNPFVQQVGVGQGVVVNIQPAPVAVVRQGIVMSAWGMTKTAAKLAALATGVYAGVKYGSSVKNDNVHYVAAGLAGLIIADALTEGVNRDLKTPLKYATLLSAPSLLLKNYIENR